MSLVVSTGVDPREEMDDTALQAKLRRRNDPGSRSPAAVVSPRSNVPPIASKTKFMIRTLPKDCNPTPVTAHATTTTASGSAQSLLSPTTARRLSHSNSTLHTAATTSTSDSDALPDDNPFDDITEAKLRTLSGQSDLSRVTHLEMTVDAGKQSVEAIGELLPALQHLKLQRSTLHSFRDLGTSLHALRILYVMRSGISDLDGIGALAGLQELYLQYNDISDLSPLTLHDEIQVIDLEGNCVTDVGQIEQLAFCAQLTTLTLEANPICRIQPYRQIVVNVLPQLTTLDDQVVTATERTKLSDDAIDAAIELHRNELQAASCIPTTIDDRAMIADSIKAVSHMDVQSPRTLARNVSTQRISNADTIADTLRNNDSGSSLTHGTDIVFAGNVTSSLRRHRSSETESTDPHLAAFALLQVQTQQQPPFASSSSSRPLSPPTHQNRPKTPMDRPKTPARMSITETLDRANELETHKSRDAILHELKAWQQEGTVSQLGATHCVREHGGSNSPSSKTTTTTAAAAHRTSASRSSAAASEHRRPSTSAGVLRNGASVKEAFVEPSASNSSNSASNSSAVARVPLHRRSVSSTGGGSSSSGHVDILILDEGDERRPCSPTKSSKGIFTTTPAPSIPNSASSREWNLAALAPTLDLSTAEASWRNFPQATATTSSAQPNDRVFQKTPRFGNDTNDDDAHNSDSSGSDSEHDAAGSRSRTQRLAARTTQKKKTPAVKTTSVATAPATLSMASSATFFNVAASLDAIDKWRDGMMDDDDDKTTATIVRVNAYQPECISPTSTSAAVVTSSSSSSAAVRDGSEALAAAAARTPTSVNQHQEVSIASEPQALEALSPTALGPANYETDERIVAYFRTKHKIVAETKTRDGFRRYFRGIEAERLERILTLVFADAEKVRRRLQLMNGFYRHELSSS